MSIVREGFFRLASTGKIMLKLRCKSAWVRNNLYNTLIERKLRMPLDDPVPRGDFLIITLLDFVYAQLG